MKKVLIADDSLFMRKVLQDLLPKDRYNVVEAGSGKEAVHQYDKERPDLVLLDIVMPEGEAEGVRVLQVIRKKDPQARIVMITAVGQDKVIEECRKHGVQDYIVKPFDDKKVAETVAKYLG